MAEARLVGLLQQPIMVPVGIQPAFSAMISPIGLLFIVWVRRLFFKLSGNQLHPSLITPLQFLDNEYFYFYFLKHMSLIRNSFRPCSIHSCSLVDIHERFWCGLHFVDQREPTIPYWWANKERKFQIPPAIQTQRTGACGASCSSRGHTPGLVSSACFLETTPKQEPVFLSFLFLLSPSS